MKTFFARVANSISINRMLARDVLFRESSASNRHQKRYLSLLLPVFLLILMKSLKLRIMKFEMCHVISQFILCETMASCYSLNDATVSISADAFPIHCFQISPWLVMYYSGIDLFNKTPQLPLRFGRSFLSFQEEGRVEFLLSFIPVR